MSVALTPGLLSEVRNLVELLTSGLQVVQWSLLAALEMSLGELLSSHLQAQSLVLLRALLSLRGFS